MTEAPIVSQTDIDAPDELEARREKAPPTPGVEFKVLDNGELVVKGPQVMRGYVDGSLDAEAFTDDGWLHTGDMARFDEHGAVIITGRIKDIIVRKGENISAKEVEDVLLRAPEDRRRRGARHPRRRTRRDGRRVRRAEGSRPIRRRCATSPSTARRSA